MKRALLMVFLIGCSSPPKTFDQGSPDSGATTPDTGTVNSCTYPAGPYGSTAGSFVRITHVSEGYFSAYPIQPSKYVMDLVKKNKPM